MEFILQFGMTTWILGAAVALAIYLLLMKIQYHFWKVRNVPSDNPISFLGAMYLRKENRALFEIDTERYKKYGRVHGTYFGGSPILMVADPELLRLILVKDFHTFPDRRVFLKGKVLEKMLNIVNGEDWKRLRTLVTPVFTSGKLRKLALLINKSAEGVTNSFLKYADENVPVEVKRLFGAFSLDVIASTAFGTELDSINNPDNIFVDHARKVFSNGISWKLVLYSLSPKVFHKMGLHLWDSDSTDFFTKIVLEIKDRRLKEGKSRDDFLQMLMNCELENEAAHTNGNNDGEKDAATKSQKIFKALSTDELVAQCVIFFLAGYDTTATTLSLVVYNLALNQECQERVLDEVDEAWEKNGKFDYDVVKSMPYLDAVVSESLRLYPPGVRLERRCVEDYELGDTGITIPKGLFVDVPVHAIHHDPEFFPDPEAFKPERFLPENKDLIQPYTYLPFGAGPRNCVAMRFALMEVKLGLVNVLKKTSFHVCPETKIPLDHSSGGLIMPKAVTLRVERRS